MDLYELPVPESGLERFRVLRINQKVRELSASVHAISSDLMDALSNNALFEGERTLDKVMKLGLAIEAMTEKLRFGRNVELRKRQKEEVASTPLEMKKRWASYFIHEKGGISNFLQGKEKAWKALDAHAQAVTPVEIVANELQRMKELGLLWGGTDLYGLTVTGVRFVRRYGFPHWLARHTIWKWLIWWVGVALGIFGLVANIFQVFGCYV